MNIEQKFTLLDFLVRNVWVFESHEKEGWVFFSLTEALILLTANSNSSLSILIVTPYFESKFTMCKVGDLRHLAKVMF